ncbi:MAG: GNAT family N-acetyltransferase [Rhodocyclales bacterium]|nr:GNAT family N-acetyltransferase [Rhodocyclales bacterium]
MNYRILPIAEELIPSFRETADAIFRESRMFSFFEAPPLEQFKQFVQSTIRNDEPQFVAVSGDAVIGWCDILIKPRPAQRHSGVLGVGVLSAYRRQGVGMALLEATINTARNKGLTRIELYVRTDNENARRLYEKFGFAVEGLLRKHIIIDGAYRDSYIMSMISE